jgi:hypothetical protein
MYLFFYLVLITTSGTSGAQATSNIRDYLLLVLRLMLIATLLLYFIPLIFYWIFFCRVKVFCEVLIGFFSFLFYTPTYLNILNTYSLCKIDDFSWGTKGLDADASEATELSQSWKLIKFIHIAKYFIWNIIIAAILLTLGANYDRRFYVTLVMIFLVFSSMFVKVFIGIIYMLIYKCRSPSLSRTADLSTTSRIDEIISHYEPEIMDEIHTVLKEIKD